MNRTLLFTFALLAVAVGCDKQSRVTTPQKIMSYTLDICGDKTVQNPSEAGIRAAVSALDTKKGDAFLILGPTQMTYIQTSGDPKVGFDLEYQEADAQHHYRAKRNFTADEIVKVFVSYLSGSGDWKKAADWEQVKW
jgi:hypothetical protein